MASTKSSSLATVKHSITKHCPILTPGDVSAKVLVDLGDAHNEYFIAKDIAETDKVKKILGGFKDVHIHDWIACEREQLIALVYKDFMAKVRSNYLPADWEETPRSQLLGMRMSKDTKFWDWCQEVRALNIVLRGSDSHLSETALRNQLEAALEANLHTYCFREKLNKITVLKDWVLVVKAADEKLKDDRKRAREIVSEETQRNAKRPALASTSRSNVNNNRTASSTDTTIPRPPRLKDEERALLVKHNGCFCCCQFNQNHSGHNCPNGYPNGSSYKKLTASCDAAGNAPKTANKFTQNVASSSKGKGGKAITSVAAANDADSSGEEEDFVSSVMPNAALGNGSSSDDDILPSSSPP
ncbi:hypothetical protein BJ912DRAFT_922532 [Pholiota molesta]|nr:hypothetical protein BJ912DRAFT_922532 [Pholiota molesta]